jgi:hypothetical protein
MNGMRSDLEDGLRILREATERAKSIRPTVDEQYLQWILQIEARPENQSGADKSGGWRAHLKFLSFFENARGPFRP